MGVFSGVLCGIEEMAWKTLCGFLEQIKFRVQALACSASWKHKLKLEL
jgi:hypothetical protein